jgi:hypothetical protein
VSAVAVKVVVVAAATDGKAKVAAASDAAVVPTKAAVLVGVTPAQNLSIDVPFCEGRRLVTDPAE